MAPQGTAVQLTTLCAVASFIWISYTFERHTLIAQPRLSSFFILLISGLFSFLASFFSSWLPGANGRFDDESQALKTSAPILPRRPRRYFSSALIICIILRLEILYRIASSFQCSTPGVEAFLPAVLVAYDLVYNRKPRAVAIRDDDYDDFDRDCVDDFKDWLGASKPTLIAAVLVFNYGTFLSLGQSPRSTYFCSSLSDSHLGIFILQLLGLVLDGVIAVLLWRTLAWAKTTKARLRALGGILLQASFGISLLLAASRLLRTEYPRSPFAGVGTLYFFDLFIDSCALSALILSASLLTSESGPLAPTGLVTFAAGFSASWQNLLRIGTWLQASRLDVLVPLYLICFGFVVFIYTSDLRSVVFIRRAFFAIILFAVLTGTTVYAILTPIILDHHPLERLIYDSRVNSDRWLRYASISGSLHVAVEVYQERHGGRDPPPNFDKWYEFAKQRKSPIIDHFEQIKKDLSPFWGMKPETIRERLKEAAKGWQIVMITIENGQISHSEFPDAEHEKAVRDIEQMIAPFAQHLPDMALPINLADRPRVLARHDEVQHLVQSGTRKKLTIMPRGAPDHAIPQVNLSQIIRGQKQRPITLPDWGPIGVRELRKMEALACPADSPGRSGMYWNVRDLCAACAAPQSPSQFLTNWERSLDTCSQPDLLNLHGFHMHPLPPTAMLLPVFSRYKPDHFNDILIPAAHPDDDAKDSARDFQYRHDKLFWRGRWTERLAWSPVLHGHQQNRLLRLVNNASASDAVTMLLPRPAKRGGAKFRYDAVPAADASAALPLDVGVSDYAGCLEPDCALGRGEFGQSGDGGAAAAVLDHRYVLLVDGEAGPATATLSALRSASAPFVATVFRTWYTERVMAWVHFVPVDVRFHALHSTAAYFLGLKGRGRVGGREVDMPGRMEDGRWIASEGRAWAKKALRREDMEVYLFRLLLEWGRLLSDDRDNLGFQL